jgi:uncharacterized protein YndB with AHSA1/START domain
MPPIVSTIDITRPPDEVFSYMTDPRRFVEWQKDIVRVELAGSRFTTTRRIGPGEQTMTQEVTESTPPRRWSARGVDGAIRPDATVTVEPLDGGTRSRVTISLDFTGHGMGVALLPLVRRLAAKGGQVSYRNLKERLESPS